MTTSRYKVNANVACHWCRQFLKLDRIIELEPPKYNSRVRFDIQCTDPECGYITSVDVSFDSLVKLGRQNVENNV